MKWLFKNIKARLTAKRFNVWTERIDPKRKSDYFLGGDFIASDGELYYGNRFFVFFKSYQNSWWEFSPNNPANQ